MVHLYWTGQADNLTLTGDHPLPMITYKLAETPNDIGGENCEKLANAIIVEGQLNSKTKETLEHHTTCADRKNLSKN